MNTAWKWIVGIAVGLVALKAVFLAYFFGFVAPTGGYGMMGRRWGMPMMWGPYPMMGFGGILGGLIQLGLLGLIVLGIVWLWGAIARQNRKHE